MNLFKQMESGRRCPPLRVLMYGNHGIGPSSFAASLPSHVFVPADDSTAHLNCQRFPVARRVADLMQALQDLYIEPHDYRTVILDPLGALEWLIHDEVCLQRHVKDLAEAPSAASDPLLHWRRMLRRLGVLRHNIGLHIILVGHAQELRLRVAMSHGSATSVGAARRRIVQRYRPAISRRIPALLQSCCDAVLFTTHADALLTLAGGKTAAANPSSPAAELDDQRVLYTTPSSRHTTKNHLDFPPQLPLRSDALTPYLRKASVPPQVPPASFN